MNTSHPADRKLPRTVLGFDWFDFAVVVLHLGIVLFALPLSHLYAMPFFRLAVGLGFFWAVWRFGRSEAYAKGVQELSKRWPPVEFVMFVGGFIAGSIVFAVFVVRTIDVWVNDLLVIYEWKGESFLLILWIPLGLTAGALIPWTFLRAQENKSEETLPLWERYLGIAFVLITANILLDALYTAFLSESSDVGMNLILSVFILCFFYFPVKLQELFLKPEEARVQSVIQTIVVVAICQSIPAWMLLWL